MSRLHVLISLSALVSACAGSAATKPVSAQHDLGPLKASTEQFSIESADGKTHLEGQIDWPAKQCPCPVVVMVPGTGPFDRDVHFSSDMAGTRPYSPDGLLFKSLADRLVAVGVAVARVDKRGFSCNLVGLSQSKPKLGEKELLAAYRDECMDQQLTKTVTPETIRSDIAKVFEHVGAHAKTDSIAVLAHSEGSIHVARLVENRSISPSAILFIGGLAESPVTMIRWQVIDRSVEVFESIDKDGDGSLSTAEAAAFTGTDHPLMSGIAPIFAAGGPWRIDELKPLLAGVYEEQKRQALTAPDAEPFGVLATFAWWKMWFLDETPVLSSLRDFEGRIVFHSGEKDLQTPGPREFEYIRSQQDSLKSKPKLVLHSGLGHSLGEHGIYGPMKESALQLVVDDVLSLVSEGM